MSFVGDGVFLSLVLESSFFTEFGSRFYTFSSIKGRLDSRFCRLEKIRFSISCLDFRDSVGFFGALFVVRIFREKWDCFKEVVEFFWFDWIEYLSF